MNSQEGASGSGDF